MVLFVHSLIFLHLTGKPDVHYFRHTQSSPSSSSCSTPRCNSKWHHNGRVHLYREWPAWTRVKWQIVDLRACWYYKWTFFCVENRLIHPKLTHNPKEWCFPVTFCFFFCCACCLTFFPDPNIKLYADLLDRIFCRTFFSCVFNLRYLRRWY